MRAARIETVDEMVAAVRSLSAALARESADASASVLDSALRGSYTTSTEALIALADALTEADGALPRDAQSRWTAQIASLRDDAKRLTQLR